MPAVCNVIVVHGLWLASRLQRELFSNNVKHSDEGIFVLCTREHFVTVHVEGRNSCQKKITDVMDYGMNPYNTEYVVISECIEMTAITPCKLSREPNSFQLYFHVGWFVAFESIKIVRVKIVRNCNFVGLLNHPFLLQLVLARLGHIFSCFETTFCLHKPQSDIHCNRSATSPRPKFITIAEVAEESQLGFAVGRRLVGDWSGTGCRLIGDWSATSWGPLCDLMQLVADRSLTNRRPVADQSPTK